MQAKVGRPPLLVARPLARREPSHFCRLRLFDLAIPGRFSLAGASDLTGLPATFTVDRGAGPVQVTVDQMTPAELTAAGVNAVSKTLHVDLNQAGYNTVEKVEGLTIIDRDTIAVINDNDFTVAAITIDPATGLFTRTAPPDPIVLGIIDVNWVGPTGSGPPQVAHHFSVTRIRPDRDKDRDADDKTSDGLWE